MKYRSVFDIIGPVMVGPSSSHTAGAVRIGLFTRYIFGMQPEDVKITLYGSFKETYKEAGMEFEFIESGIEHIHPNTAKIEVQAGRHSLDLIGKSIGGGKMVIFELLGFDVNLSGDFPTYFIFYKFNDKNKKELSLRIQEIFGDKKVSEKYSSSILEGTNLLVVESLEELNEESIQKITELEFVNEVKFADKL